MHSHNLQDTRHSHTHAHATETQRQHTTTTHKRSHTRTHTHDRNTETAHYDTTHTHRHTRTHTRTRDRNRETAHYDTTHTHIHTHTHTHARQKERDSTLRHDTNSQELARVNTQCTHRQYTNHSTQYTGPCIHCQHNKSTHKVNTQSCAYTRVCACACHKGCRPLLFASHLPPSCKPRAYHTSKNFMCDATLVA